MPHFSDVSLLPDDPIFRLPLLFADDQRACKVNLGIGVYQNESGKPEVLATVRLAEKAVFEKHLGKNYLPIDGDPIFIRETLTTIFGNSPFIEQKHAFAVQTVGGAGALRLGAEFLKTLLSPRIYVSDPTWVNHHNIFKRAGMEIHTYPYFDTALRGLNFNALCQSVKEMPKGSICLLQGCGHNPTGIDPTLEQWKELSALLKAQGVMPFFDLAYQGLCNGLDKDAEAIRFFAAEGHEMLVAYSFSKNLGLYGERVGALAIVTQNPESTKNAASQLRQMIRSVYSTPPLHGGRLVATILSDPALKNEWLLELTDMRERLGYLRQQLANYLKSRSDYSGFTLLDQQQGMFSYCGITPKQVQQLIQQYAIYLPEDGRINIAGLNKKNMEYVGKSILDTMSP